MVPTSAPASTPASLALLLLVLLVLLALLLLSRYCCRRYCCCCCCCSRYCCCSRCYCCFHYCSFRRFRRFCALHSICCCYSCFGLRVTTTINYGIPLRLRLLTHPMVSVHHHAERVIEPLRDPGGATEVGVLQVESQEDHRAGPEAHPVDSLQPEHRETNPVAQPVRLVLSVPIHLRALRLRLGAGEEGRQRAEQARGDLGNRLRPLRRPRLHRTGHPLAGALETLARTGPRYGAAVG
mmetsp:Transcript_26540/g.57245  ORF Transcript_26540/g.57245 Transcript_26540/m.57245 type:complete len:238 (+) Transcript_26540:240-953(+)